MRLPTFDLVIQSDYCLRNTFSFGSIQDPPGDRESHDVEHRLEDEEQEGSHVPECKSLPHSPSAAHTRLPSTAAHTGAPKASRTPPGSPSSCCSHTAALSPGLCLLSYTATHGYLSSN